MTTQNTLIAISSVVAEKIDADKMQIIASWKSTEKKTVSPANAKRTIFLPKDFWQSDESVKSVQLETLKLHILDSIAELAKDYLSTISEESNWLRTEVPQEHFTLSNLLNWNAERAAMSGRLNGDEIKKWLSESVTIRSVTEKHGEKIGLALGEQLVKLASPNHGLTNEKANKLLTNLWQADDADSTTGLRVMLRLKAISEKPVETENLLNSIL